LTANIHFFISAHSGGAGNNFISSATLNLHTMMLPTMMMKTMMTMMNDDDQFFGGLKNY